MREQQERLGGARGAAGIHCTQPQLGAEAGGESAHSRQKRHAASGGAGGAGAGQGRLRLEQVGGGGTRAHRRAQHRLPLASAQQGAALPAAQQRRAAQLGGEQRVQGEHQRLSASKEAAGRGGRSQPTAAAWKQLCEQAQLALETERGREACQSAARLLSSASRELAQPLRSERNHAAQFKHQGRGGERRRQRPGGGQHVAGGEEREQRLRARPRRQRHGQHGARAVRQVQASRAGAQRASHQRLAHGQDARRSRCSLRTSTRRRAAQARQVAAAPELPKASSSGDREQQRGRGGLAGHARCLKHRPGGGAERGLVGLVQRLTQLLTHIVQRGHVAAAAAQP